MQEGGGGSALLGEGAVSSSAPPASAQPSLGLLRRRPAHPFGPRLSSMIGRLGRWSAERPRAVLAFCGAGALLCALLLTTGVVRIVVETDSSRLWVPNSSAASQLSKFTEGFENPRIAVAIISSRDGASMTQLPQIVEAVKLDEQLRTKRIPGLGDYGDVCFRSVLDGECPPTSIFTLWNNTDPAKAKDGTKVSAVLPMIRAALDAASGSSLDVALSDYLGCIAQNPTDAVATFRMLRLVFPLEDGDNGTAWADHFQHELLHASFENIAVDSVVPGSYDKELSGMSWDDLVLALYWLPMLAVGVPMYMAHAHGLGAREAFQLLLLEIGAILLSITAALVAMALLGLCVSPMWLAAPLLAMGYGLDDMFVFLAAFSEARAQSVGRPVLLEHITLAFESAGISCLCTSLTSFVVFIIGGATSSVLAIQSFCWLSALIALIDFGLQVAVFGAAMALVLKPRYDREGEEYAARAESARARTAHRAGASARGSPPTVGLRADGPGAGQPGQADAAGAAGADGGLGAAANAPLLLAPLMPTVFAEPYADPRYLEKGRYERFAALMLRSPPKWAQIVHHYTFMPILFILLICTACAANLKEAEVPLGIDVAGLAKAGSFLIDFDLKSSECFNQGEWGYVYVNGGEPHSFGYQQQLGHLMGALQQSEHVLSVANWLGEFAHAYAPKEQAKALDDPQGAFAAALREWARQPANQRHAANVVWQLPARRHGGDERPTDAEAEAGGIVRRSLQALAVAESGGGRRASRRSAEAAAADAAGGGDALAPVGAATPPPPPPPPVRITTRALEAQPELEQVARIGALRLPIKLAPCDADESDGESLHECQLRAMLAVRQLVAAHRDGLDAVADAPSFLSLEQYVHMRADVRRALLRCTLAAAAVTFVLVLGYSVWEALIVSLICLGSLALCNVVILGVMKALSMNLHFLSAVMLQMGVGFIVDYHIHIASKFMATKVGSTAAKRVVKTIESVGGAVFASMVTTLLVVLPFLWARWAAMRMLMTLMFIIVAVGGVFSLGFLPLVLAHLPQAALAPAPGRRRQAGLLVAKARRLAELTARARAKAGGRADSTPARAAHKLSPSGAYWAATGGTECGSPPTGNSVITPCAPGSAYSLYSASSQPHAPPLTAEELAEAVAALRERSATVIAACWSAFRARKMYVAVQFSSGVFLQKWRQAAVHEMPTLPARLTVHAPCASRLRVRLYEAAAAFHIGLIVFSFLWEQLFLWTLPSWQVSSLLVSFITCYLSLFFCGFILTMADPHERHNLVLNALAPLHPSLLGPRAHLRPKARAAAANGAHAGANGGAKAAGTTNGTANAGGDSSAHAPPKSLRGILPKGEWPRVAIIVPCYKEPDSIIAATIGGCLQQVYPSTRLHVYLLDDNQNQATRNARKAVMDAKYHELFALPNGQLPPAHKRPGFSVVWRPDNLHAKAGNMNHWLAGDGCGFAWEFFALFDCDMIPHRFFVQEMLPAMLHIVPQPALVHASGQPALAAPQPPRPDGGASANARAIALPSAGYAALSAAEQEERPLRVCQDYSVAFITCRQTFRDVPALDPLGHGQDMMYDTWEPSLDKTDQALFLGTNAIFSREAVDAIGHFPLHCLTEDTLMCLRLHTAGYRALYYPRTFTSGLAPDTIRSAFRQRTRWAHGNLQILWRFNPALNRKLHPRMRVVFSTVLIVNLSGFPLLLFTAISIGLQLGVLQIAMLPVALGLAKLLVWGWQYVLLFNTAHIMPWRHRPIQDVWRQTQMALCFTMCGAQVILEQSYKALVKAVCGIKPKEEVFKPTIDINRVELPTPPTMVQFKIALFIFAVSLIAQQWVRTLMPLVFNTPFDPDAFTYLVATWGLLALPFMLGWPWTKIFISELRKLREDRAAEREREKAKAASARGAPLL